MPDRLLKRAKQVAAERRTTVRALVVDALERALSEKPGAFRLREAAAGPVVGDKGRVSTAAINAAIDQQRESRFLK